GLQIDSDRNVYQGISLESLLVTIDPLNAPPTAGWVMICAHYDSISNRSPGWNASTSAAPGADDNGTGTAALLEYARILSQNRASLTHRIVLAFFDGEEPFFKGRRTVRPGRDSGGGARAALRRERRHVPRQLHVPHGERHARERLEPPALAEGREADPRGGARSRDGELGEVSGHLT